MHNDVLSTKIKLSNKAIIKIPVSLVIFTVMEEFMIQYRPDDTYRSYSLNFLRGIFLR